MSKDAFERAANPVVNELLDAVMKRVLDELTPDYGENHVSLTPPERELRHYTPHDLAMAITLGISEAIPFIVTITEAYRAELDSQEGKS